MSNIPEKHHLINDAELQAIVDDHCNRRLKAFGIDWESPEGIREFIKDQTYIRTQRKLLEGAARVGLFTFITLLVTGMVGIFVAWFNYRRNAP